MHLNINKSILDDRSGIRDHYCGKYTWDSEYATVLSEPFQVIKLKNLIDKKCMTQLISTLDKVPLIEKNNDMYKFSQSPDLKNYTLKPLQNFIHFLKNDLKDLICYLMGGIELNDNLSITASLYQYGEMLLCHDDRCEDRCVAFVYYITGGDDFGGNFDMFNSDLCTKQPCKVVKSIPPEANTFLFFEVGDLSYHQVSEVTHPDFRRLSINGWFHSDRVKESSLFCYQFPLPKCYSQVETKSSVYLEKYINPIYCLDHIIGEMSEEFERHSFLLLEDIFDSNFYNSCRKSLMRDKLNWQKSGPPNRRCYEEAELNNVTGKLGYLIKLMMSPHFIKYLGRVTGLSLLPMEGRASGSQFTFELIKWSPGSYTILSDDDEFYKKPGLDVYLFFGARQNSDDDSSGFINYLTYGEATMDETEENYDENINGYECSSIENDIAGHSSALNVIEEDSGSNSSDEVLTVQPKDNALVLVYRKDVIRFTKYNSLIHEEPYYAIYATYYE